MVEGISIAVATSADELGTPAWNVYLINNNTHALTNVLIASTGYGFVDGAEIKTSTLRHMFERVEGKSFVQIEPIDPGLFHLNNEYWVSYYVDSSIYDKKFIFVPESITEDNLIEISMLQMMGVLHS